MRLCKTKKAVSVFVIGLLLLFLSGCGGGSASDIDVLEIDEQSFVLRMMDVFFSPDDYLGRTIRYEGLFRTLDIPVVGYIHQVYRYTLGCCGPDGVIGLDVRLDRANVEPFNDGAWVRVEGVLEEFSEMGQTLLRLDVVLIEELEERGLEFVTAR